MEKLPAQKFERKSGLVRIAGLEEDQEREILAIHGEFFEAKQKFLKHEIKKTPDQKAVISFINQKMPEFLRRYGAEPLNISEDKVHILSPDQFRGSIGGVYLPGDQTIYIRDVKDCPLLGFAKRLAHEFLHFNSFQSIQFRKKAKEIKIRRWGFKIIQQGSADFAYFRDVDEAITEELSKRFNNEFLKQMPVLEKDFAKIETFRRHQKEIAAQSNLKEGELEDLLSDVAYITTVQTGEDAEGADVEATIHSYGYAEYRKKLNKLITELYEKNKESFKDQEEIFALFAQAALSGRLLPVARLIEKTFGKGSFRRTGEDFGGKLEKI